MSTTTDTHDGAIEIRPYEDRDEPAVRDLFIRVNRQIAPEGMHAAFETYIARSLAEEIDRIPAYYRERHGSFWVADCAGALIGMYGIERVGRHSAELRRMYVVPEMRRRGIARVLLEHAERVCRDRGFRHLVLSTSEFQQPALALYAAAGFHLLHEGAASGMTNKTIGGGVRRFHLRKSLTPSDRSE